MPTSSYESLLNGLYGARASGTAYASSTTLTDVSPGSFALPANFLAEGSVLRLTAAGTFSNTGTPTLLLGFYYGGVGAALPLAASGATTTASGVTNVPWQMEYEGVVRSVGSAGTIMGNGKLFLATSLTAFSTIPIPNVAIATVTIDTTTAKSITVGAQWGANSASNTLTVTKFLVESVA